MKNLRKDWLLKIHQRVRRSRLNIYTQQRRAINTTERSNAPAMSAKTRLFKEGFFKLVDLSVLESCLEGTGCNGIEDDVGDVGDGSDDEGDGSDGSDDACTTLSFP